MTSRLSVFLLVGLFAAATLQTAGAQNNGQSNGNPDSPQDRSDQHTVTINVNNIDEIDVVGSPTITVDTLNAWVVDSDGTGSIDEVTSNASSDREVEVSVTSTNGNLANIGLRVDPDANFGGNLQTSSQGYIKLLDVSESSTNDSQDVYTGFSSVHNESIDLTYEARANASYNPSDNTDITVEYTLTANN
ncbi:hypothetical protein [Salinibacter ruber]|uniref:hypothetical protein n=1 Tax=Salinibacter ruber TaxID=146919 RepID=UPI002168CF37|nr:hypothetical protein [Salinibacter ruber]MCS4201694.1 hypothetical protein [Salinibacter ruber]